MSCFRIVALHLNQLTISRPDFLVTGCKMYGGTPIEATQIVHLANRCLKLLKKNKLEQEQNYFIPVTLSALAETMSIDIIINVNNVPVKRPVMNSNKNSNMLSPPSRLYRILNQLLHTAHTSYRISKYEASISIWENSSEQFEFIMFFYRSRAENH